MEKAVCFGGGVLVGSVGLYFLARLLEPTIEQNIISQVNNRFFAEISRVLNLDITINDTPELRVLLTQRFSGPLADAIMKGVYLK